jgi:hypothetical protein
MDDIIIKENIVGSRNVSSFNNPCPFFLLGFFFSWFVQLSQINLLQVTDTSEIVFIPQGIALLFYGTGALGLGTYIALTILLNIGS